MLKRILVLALAGLASSAWAAEPASENDKTMYTLGVLISKDLQMLELTQAEIDMVAAGMSDALLGNEPKVDLSVYGPKLQELAKQRMEAGVNREKDAARDFLARQAKLEGAQQTGSGLVYIESTAGSGASPAATDSVTVHYTGTLRDGTVFDSSRSRGEPATFPLNRVIPCWTEGLQKMKVGGKATLVCPSDIAYGDRGSPPSIPPGAVLVFDVELLGIEPAS